MHVGLIGGIGPAATVHYYRGLVAAAARAGRPLRLTIQEADFAGAIADLAAGRIEARAAVWAGHVRALAAAGAEVAAIPSMTGHAFHPALARLSVLPLCDGLAAVRDHLDAAGIARIGLMGSDHAMATRLLGALAGREVILPEDPGAVARGYLDIATAGACTAAQRAMFHAAGAGMMDRGAEAVLLGGTDLCLAFDGAGCGYPVLDAAGLHVAALARLAGLDTPTGATLP